MRFLHTSDLHLGRRLNGYMLEDDQRYMLDQLLRMAQDSRVDAIVIAGDIFDTSTPAEWAVRLWDSFLQKVASLHMPLLAVSGNHDSGVRLACASSLLQQSQVWICGQLDSGFGARTPGVGSRGLLIPPYVELLGVRFWLFPFVRPADVRSWIQRASGVDQLSTQVADKNDQVESLTTPGSSYPGHDDGLQDAQAHIASYTDALEFMCSRAESLPRFDAMPNVCIAHQFVVGSAGGPKTSDSERTTLGTLDNVDAGIFNCFDYTALGHIHKPQPMGDKTIRYSGTPLKYSGSEVADNKTACVVDIDPAAPRGSRVHIDTVAWEPLHDFRQVRGTLLELETQAEQEDTTRKQDYIYAVVTEPDPIDARARLKHVWPHTAEIRFETPEQQARGVAQDTLDEAQLADKNKLFSAFFERVVNRQLTQAERRVVDEAFEASVLGGESL